MYCREKKSEKDKEKGGGGWRQINGQEYRKGEREEQRDKEERDGEEIKEISRIHLFLNK